jgi:hypothetical protein
MLVAYLTEPVQLALGIQRRQLPPLIGSLEE